MNPQQETRRPAAARIGSFVVSVANSPRRLGLLGVFLLFAAALAYHGFEHVGYINALYWSFVTATTLGYGDLSPHTIAGKTIAVLLVGSTVIFFIPMVTASIASRLIVDRDAFTHEEQEEIKHLLRDIHDRLAPAPDTPDD